MKRFITIVLAFVLCFGLCACSAPFDKTDDKNGPTEGVSILEEFVGEWFGWGWDKTPDDPHTLSLTLNADGTCVYNGVAGTWSASSGFDFVIQGAFGNYPCYIETNKKNGMKYFLIDGPHNTVYPASAFTKVELTMDNWQQYFEISYGNAEIRKNAFGDIIGVSVRSIIGEKDTCKIGLIDPVQKPVAELTYTWGTYKCKVDMETGAFTRGELVKIGENDAPAIFTLGWGADGAELFSSSTRLDPYPEGEAYLVSEFQISRIQGTIYIYNN